MKTKIISFIQIVIAGFAIIALSTLLQPCNGEKVMKCMYSTDVVKLLFSTIILVRIIGFFSKQKITIYIDITTIVLLINIILIPTWIIGGCKMDDMACRSVTFPAIYVIAILLMIVNAITLLANVLKRKG